MAQNELKKRDITLMFGYFVRHYRKIKKKKHPEKYTVEKICKAIECSRSHLFNVEKGFRTAFSLTAIKKFVDYLQLNEYEADNLIKYKFARNIKMQNKELSDERVLDMVNSVNWNGFL